MTDLSKVYPYSVKRIQIAAFVIDTEAYGTPVTINMAQAFEADPQVDDDMIKGGGANRRAISVLTHMEWTIQKAGLQPAALNILDNTSGSLSGVTPNQKRITLQTGGTNAAYFGMIAHLPTDDGWMSLWGFPLCKVTTRMPLEMEQNQFVLPEIEGVALTHERLSGTDLPVLRVETYETDPGLITDFDAFFLV